MAFGRYTLLSHLATGGMGEIYLARLEGAQGFEKLCVIKKILPQLAEDAEFVERFLGEARTLVRLWHGSIAQVLDMGVHEGEAYMALEYVDGKDVRRVVARMRDRGQPVPLSFSLFITGRVLDALAYAHRKRDEEEKELNLIHRDISPQNILVSYEGEVKLIDFGLAKSRLTAARTHPSIILGKFLYMSPEQARHQPLDRRSDLYAVGVCLYELLSGKNPFDEVHPNELMAAVASPRIAPLQEVEPSVPAAVAQMVMRALASEPAQRFQTAEEFRTRLLACLMEADKEAGPESVSRLMRELFAAEYQAERRLLASLKEIRVVAEPAVAESPAGGTRPEPAPARLPPAFQPTPRTREDEGRVRDEAETRPGVVLDEETRPAVPLEALDAMARARLKPGREQPTEEELPAHSAKLGAASPGVASPLEPVPGSSAPTRQVPVMPSQLAGTALTPVDVPRAQTVEWSEPGPLASPTPMDFPWQPPAPTPPEPAVELALLESEVSPSSANLPKAKAPEPEPEEVNLEKTEPRVVLDESLYQDTPREAAPPTLAGTPPPPSRKGLPEGGVQTPLASATPSATGSQPAVARKGPPPRPPPRLAPVPPGAAPAAAPARTVQLADIDTSPSRALVQRRNRARAETLPLEAPPVVPPPQPTAPQQASSPRWVVWGLLVLVLVLGLLTAWLWWQRLRPVQPTAGAWGTVPPQAVPAAAPPAETPPVPGSPAAADSESAPPPAAPLGSPSAEELPESPQEAEPPPGGPAAEAAPAAEAVPTTAAAPAPAAEPERLVQPAASERKPPRRNKQPSLPRPVVRPRQEGL